MAGSEYYDDDNWTVADPDYKIEFNLQSPVEYKYNEKENLDGLLEYVNKTYDQHYSKNKFQATEFIIDGGHGIGFTLGNILKYTQRYGHKNGHNRDDIMKVLHYALIALHVHDHENSGK